MYMLAFKRTPSLAVCYTPQAGFVDVIMLHDDDAPRLRGGVDVQRYCHFQANETVELLGRVK